MKRITFSCEDRLAEAADRKAKAERRTLSGYVAMLIERDALPPASVSEGEFVAAVTEVGGPTVALRILQGARTPTRKGRKQPRKLKEAA